MERSLSPMQKVYRKFLSGRPPAAPKNTPLAAVSLALDQKARLERLLEAENISGARVRAVGVVVRLAVPASDALADSIPVRDGKEGDALATLQRYGACGVAFDIAGLIFDTQDGEQPPVLFAFPIDRSQEGEAALVYACNRQRSQALKHSVN